MTTRALARGEAKAAIPHNRSGIIEDNAAGVANAATRTRILASQTLCQRMEKAEN
jgi:hypothetical protein